MLSYWFDFIEHNDPNYQKETTDKGYWSPFVKNQQDLSADQKMRNGNFLLMSNNEIAMTNDFSSHNCKLFNFTRNPEGYKETSPGLMNELISKLKYFYASLF